MSTSVCWGSTSNRRVWQSRCRLPSLAGKHGSLWKMLSLHCGFTATMSTSTILVHLAAWPSRSSQKIKMNIVLTFQGCYNLPCLFLTHIFTRVSREGLIKVRTVLKQSVCVCVICTVWLAVLAGLCVSAQNMWKQQLSPKSMIWI